MMKIEVRLRFLSLLEKHVNKAVACLSKEDFLW